MAISKVRTLTLAYIRGKVSADEVVAAVVPSTEKHRESADQVLRATSDGDEMPTSTQSDGWADVGRYYGLMSPEQWDALLKARKKRLGY